MKKNNNIQIVYTYQINPYLLVKWQKEQIEVGLTKDYRTVYVKGPSFVFYWEKDKIAELTRTGHDIERVWHKDAETGEWYKEWTMLKSNNPFVQIIKNELIYSKEHMLAAVEVEYDLQTQKGIGQVYPSTISMAKWLRILNPFLKKIKERSFEI